MRTVSTGVDFVNGNRRFAAEWPDCVNCVLDAKAMFLGSLGKGRSNFYFSVLGLIMQMWSQRNCGRDLNGI